MLHKSCKATRNIGNEKEVAQINYYPKNDEITMFLENTEGKVTQQKFKGTKEGGKASEVKTVSKD